MGEIDQDVRDIGRLLREVEAGDGVCPAATVVPPAIQIASSAMMKCAEFLDKIATLKPGSKFRAFKWAAIRRDWSTTCFHV